MVIMNTDAEPDVAKLWALLTELMESTNSHRQYAAQLHAHANGVKGQAIHSQTGFVLRRFNLDKTKEEYDAELERMNASMSADNLALQHDNKQLNALIKDYESTLETVMDQFRNRAHEVQEHELSLIRTYETQLLARESAALAQALSASSATSASLTRLSVLLRRTLRALQGEDLPDAPPDSVAYRAYLTSLSFDAAEEQWDDVTKADWALERECELARLEGENRVLRRLLGEKVEDPPGVGVEERERREGSSGERGMAEDGRMSAVPTLASVSRPPGSGHMLGGPKGTVGPFGTYKKMRAGLAM